jgi:hypothetical protein
MGEVVKLVCSVCGSNNLQWESDSPDPTRAFVKQRSVDPRWPMAKCLDHAQRGQPFVPVISERAFQAKQKRPAEAQPIQGPW